MLGSFSFNSCAQGSHGPQGTLQISCYHHCVVPADNGPDVDTAPPTGPIIRRSLAEAKLWHPGWDTDSVGPEAYTIGRVFLKEK